MFLALCRCSLALDVDGLDVPGGPDATSSSGADAAGATNDAGADTGWAGDARADARWDAEAGAKLDASQAGADAGTDGGASDGQSPAFEAGADAIADAAEGGSPVIDASDAGTPGADAGSPGADASDDGGSGGSTDACVLVTHTNGVGQTWQDCSALGTHNRNEAQRACNALTSTGGSGNCVSQSACNMSYAGVSFQSGGTSTTYLWIYGTQNGANASAGDVLVYPSGTVQCANLPTAAASWE